MSEYSNGWIANQMVERKEKYRKCFSKKQELRKDTHVKQNKKEVDKIE